MGYFAKTRGKQRKTAKKRDGGGGGGLKMAQNIRKWGLRCILNFDMIYTLIVIKVF